MLDMLQGSIPCWPIMDEIIVLWIVGIVVVSGIVGAFVFSNYVDSGFIDSLLKDRVPPSIVNQKVYYVNDTNITTDLFKLMNISSLTCGNESTPAEVTCPGRTESLMPFLYCFICGKKVIVSPVSEVVIHANCTYRKIDDTELPDSHCTPGAVMESNLSVICQKGYTVLVRDVNNSEKNLVYEMYGIVNRSAYSYEIDHLVPLELGGGNEVSNLWPERYNMTDGARVKDKVENCLNRLVCSGKMTLQNAQYAIRTDWRKMKLPCGVSS